MTSDDVFPVASIGEVQAMARALLEVMDANPAPVWGQARFKGGDWASCSAEHAAMVMANPEEWGDYECRYLYATPPAPRAPDGWKLVPVEPDWNMLSADGCKEHHEGKACSHHDNRKRIWRAMLSAAPAPAPGVE